MRRRDYRNWYMMQIRPDDQVLDSFIIYSKIAKAKSDVDKFMTGYHFWVWKIRKEIG